MDLTSDSLIVIAGHVEKPGELAALARTCSRVSRAAEAVLYHTVDLKSREDVELWDEHFKQYPQHMDMVVRVNVHRGSYTVACVDRIDALHIPRASKIDTGDIRSVIDLLMTIASITPLLQLRNFHFSDAEELFTDYDMDMTVDSMLYIEGFSASRCGRAVEASMSRMVHLEDVKLERLSRIHQHALSDFRMERLFAGSLTTLRSFSISGDANVPGTRIRESVLPALTTVDLQVSSINARDLFMMCPSLKYVTLGSACRISAKMNSGQTIHLSFLQCSAVALTDLFGVQATHLSITDLADVDPSSSAALGYSLLNAGPQRLDVHGWQGKGWKTRFNESLASVRYLALYLNGSDDALVSSWFLYPHN